MGIDLQLGVSRDDRVNIHARTRRGYEFLAEHTLFAVPDRMYITTSADGAVEIELLAREHGLRVE
jgi:hypothetical protein